MEESLCGGCSLSSCEWNSDVSSVRTMLHSGQPPLLRPEPARITSCAEDEAAASAEVKVEPRASEPSRAPSADLHDAKIFALAAATAALIGLGLGTDDVQLGVVAAVALGLLIGITALTCEGTLATWRRLSDATEGPSPSGPRTLPRTAQV